MSHIPAASIFNSHTADSFEQVALSIFRYQARENPVYASFVKALGISAGDVQSLSEIPFLPIEFFKTHSVLCGHTNGQEVVFTSSGTTGMSNSKHIVRDISLYAESFAKAFTLFYGPVDEYAILALLPSYLEREGSSLIYMVDALIRNSKCVDSGYYLHNHKELFEKLEYLKSRKKKVILIGVTYALLDFIEKFPVNFPDLILMETGGMKGKRREMIREELHQQLSSGFGVAKIHSEYGMTEMLSQAYSKGDGIFECPPWMRILIRDTNDPFCYLETAQTGGLNVIDLANLHSCSFIATQDLGKAFPNGTFEVLGRFDNSDIRGCNLLVQ